MNYGTRGPEDSALIANHVQLCFAGFEKLCLSFTKADTAIKRKVAPFNINDEIGKFRLWCGNIAAHRRGRSSLDYKLREASHIRDRVLDLLRSLESIIREANEIVNGERVPWEDISDSDSDCPDDDLVHEETGTTELQQLISNIAEIVTCLMRLSMAIRNPAPHDQFKESVHIDTSHFEVFDIEHVRGKFPNAEEYLVIRLGKAISRRRQYLRYRDEHRKKLEQGLQASIPEATPSIIVVPIIIAPSEMIQSTVASSIPFAIKASSSAAGLDDNDYYEDTLSHTSYASSASNTTKLRPPPLPEQGQDGDPFECPLCFRLTSVRKLSAWHKHVYRDLQPYVCTWEDCTTPDFTYESRHDWFSHEVHAHRTFWECIDGCNMPFYSPSDFQQHLQLAHPDWSSEGRLGDMMRSCERTTDMDAEAKCVLCQQKLPSLTQLRRHLGKHQEELTLFALPSYMKDDQDQSDDNLEENECRSLLSSVRGDSQQDPAESSDSPVQSHKHEFKLVMSHPSYENLNCSLCSEAVSSNYLECQGCETSACESCFLKKRVGLASTLGQIRTYKKTLGDTSDGKLGDSLGREPLGAFAVVDDQGQEASSKDEPRQSQSDKDEDSIAAPVPGTYRVSMFDMNEGTHKAQDGSLHFLEELLLFSPDAALNPSEWLEISYDVQVPRFSSLDPRQVKFLGFVDNGRREPLSLAVTAENEEEAEHIYRLLVWNRTKKLGTSKAPTEYATRKWEEEEENWSHQIQSAAPEKADDDIEPRDANSDAVHEPTPLPSANPDSKNFSSYPIMVFEVKAWLDGSASRPQELHLSLRSAHLSVYSTVQNSSLSKERSWYIFYSKITSLNVENDHEIEIKGPLCQSDAERPTLLDKNRRTSLRLMASHPIHTAKIMAALKERMSIAQPSFTIDSAPCVPSSPTPVVVPGSNAVVELAWQRGDEVSHLEFDEATEITEVQTKTTETKPKSTHVEEVDASLQGRSDSLSYPVRVWARGEVKDQQLWVYPTRLSFEHLGDTGEEGNRWTRFLVYIKNMKSIDLVQTDRIQIKALIYEALDDGTFLSDGDLEEVLLFSLIGHGTRQLEEVLGLVRQKMVQVVHSQKPTPAQSTDRSVGFMKDPVTGLSRPLNTAESWAAYDFEMHARKCAYCKDPYEVHRSHGQLCDVGHRLAQDVAHFIYNHANGLTYSTVEEDHKLVRVEIPASYDEVRGLLKAIERSLRHRSRTPFVSQDLNFKVSSRDTDLSQMEIMDYEENSLYSKPLRQRSENGDSVRDLPLARTEAEREKNLRSDPDRHR